MDKAATDHERAGAPAQTLSCTRPVRALGHTFEVATTDPALAAYVETLFAPMATAAGAGPSRTMRYSVVEQEVGAPTGPVWEVALDGQEIVRTGDPAQALAMLLWDVNRSVVSRTEGLLLLHAAAAERDGQVIVLPGAMEAGKTTMVAGLLRAGLRYLTDEVTAIDEDGRVDPYPKALSVDPGSWETLADLKPEVPDGARRYLPDQWQVTPSSVREDAVAPGGRPRLFVLPRYEPGAQLRLTALSRADALIAVAGCAFRIEDDPDRTLGALAQVLRGCATYEMVHSDLDEAVGAVIALLDSLAGAAPAARAQGATAASEATHGQHLGGVRRTAQRGGRSMARTIKPDEVALGFAPRRHPGITSVELDGEVVLYTGDGTMHKLDPIATALWNFFDGSVTLEELVDDLDSVYEDTQAERISEDVLTCVRELGRQGLLENVEAPVEEGVGTPEPGGGP